jgi:transaldolase
MIQRRNPGDVAKEIAAAPATPMRRTIELGTDFWNDSCDRRELAEAVAQGAVGATSNPVIVNQAVRDSVDEWIPVLQELIDANPTATEDEIAWSLIGHVARDAAELLRPVYEATSRHKGFLSVQVNPKYYANKDLMVTHARVLSRIAPNVAVKVPATEPGVAAMEKLTAEGIRINATVCFSVAQALACAEAVERGMAQAQENGRDCSTLFPNITIMVGRIDDHLRRIMNEQSLTLDPGHTNWAGVAIFKRAWHLFQKRGYHSTLLAAAYRYPMHWTELVGENVAQTMPYSWWQRFNASGITPQRRIHKPVDAKIIASLEKHFGDFRRAYDENGMQPAEFVHFGATAHTLDQFLDGYQKLLEVVRKRMLWGM